MSQQRGFTLIELMIVVAIIAILASIALPAYQDYMSRSQLTAALADIAPGRTAFETIYVTNNNPTFNVTDLGLQTKTTRCSSITVDPSTGGNITCTVVGNPRVNGKTIQWVRNASTGNWSCQTNVVEAKFKPDGC